MNKLFLINANINESSSDPDSNGITTKKITRLVWGATTNDAIKKLNNRLQENSKNLNTSFNLTNIEVFEAIE